jgi:hypothetical protein
LVERRGAVRRDLPDEVNMANDNKQWAQRQEHSEGTIAKSIEEQTAKLPSDLFLWAAVSVMATSAVLQVSGHKQVSNFVGEWVPTLLIFGLYNKMVKLLGSEPRPAAA